MGRPARDQASGRQQELRFCSVSRSGCLVGICFGKGRSGGQEFVGPGQHVGKLLPAHARPHAVVAQGAEVLRVNKVTMKARIQASRLGKRLAEAGNHRAWLEKV